MNSEQLDKRKIHIGIDAHAIGARQGGNETYIRNLILALAGIDAENRYTIYLTDSATARRWREDFVPAHPNFRIRQLPPPTPLVRMPVALAFDLKLHPVDVLHVQYTAPPFCPVPVLAMIHDLAFEHLPGTFTRRGSFQLKLTVRRTARRAARIATVSEFSRQDLIRTYGLDPSKVAVTYNGIEERFSPKKAYPGEDADLRAKFGIEGSYILAVGSLQPRKNLVRLIRAYSRLRRENPDFRHRLVIVGRRLWLADEIFAEVRRQQWAGDVILTGYVDDGDLPALYRSADVFVYPSIFEGFGLPPLEAMACGTPVITSSTSSLPEVCGDAALFVDPMDEAAIANAIARASADAGLRETLSRKGPLQAAKYTWRDTAQRTLRLYRECFESGR